MTDDQQPEPGGRPQGPPAADGQPAVPQLTPEEQMALFEKDLRENDCGHQPC
jgi:hypothetical protein